MNQANSTEARAEVGPLPLSAGAVVQITSANELVGVNRPSLLKAVPDGNGGANVTVTFNLSSVTVISDNEMGEDDLGESGDEKVHFAFSNPSTGAIAIRTGSSATLKVEQVNPNDTDRSVAVTLKFTIDDGKVGGAG